MTGEEYREALFGVVTSARLLMGINVPDLLERIDKAETLGPMIDPTLWIRNNRKMAEDKEMLEAALPLWRFARKLEKRANDEKGENRETSSAEGVPDR